MLDYSWCCPVDMIAQCNVQIDAMMCYAMLDYSWSAIDTYMQSEDM